MLHSGLFQKATNVHNHNASVGPVLPLVLDQAVGEAVGGVGGVSDDPGPQQAGGRGGYIPHTGGRGWVVDPDVAQTLPQWQTVFRIGSSQPSLHKQCIMRVPYPIIMVLDSEP